MRRFQHLLIYAVVTGVLFFIWKTPYVWPLKTFAVFIHELGHAFAALISGGSVESFTVDADESGLAMTRGGWALLIYPAGYLGSVLFGGAMMALAHKTKWSAQILGLMGLVMAAMTLLYARNFFGFAFGLLFGLGLMAISWKAKSITQPLLAWLGFFSLAFGVYDIWEDILTRPELETDARLLSEITMVPTMVWGVLWMLMALVAVFFFVRWSLPKEKEMP